MADTCDTCKSYRKMYHSVGYCKHFNTPTRHNYGCEEWHDI